MKKYFVLVVLLCFAGNFTLLAQNIKADTTATPNVSKADAAKAAAEKKKELEKAAKIAERNKKDSLATVKNAKNAADKIKKETDAAAKTQALALEKKQKDSIKAAKISADFASKAAPGATAPAATPILSIANSTQDSLARIKTAKNTADKSKKDADAAAKTAKLTADKFKRDSIKNAKMSTGLANTVAPMPSLTTQPDTSKLKAAQTNKTPATTPTRAQKAAAERSRKDSIKAAKLSGSPSTPTIAGVSMSPAASKAAIADSIRMAKQKSKLAKGPSAKELKKAAFKADPANWTEKEIGLRNMRMKIDPVRRDSLLHLTPIPYDESVPFALLNPHGENLRFYHRYWREIDLTDPKNKQFASYHPQLITSLLKSIKEKQIQVYSPTVDPVKNPTGDSFTIPIAYDQFMAGLSDTAVVNILDKDGNITGTKSIPNPFTPEKIVGYRIKEDVFFDKTRSKSETRMIGIAPLVKLTLSSGEVLNVQPLFWIKLKDIRKVMVKIDLDSTKKIGTTLDDVFLRRQFNSTIVEESNVLHQRIKDYKPEPDQQLAEAARMEKKIIVFKNRMWTYTLIDEGTLPVSQPAKSSTSKSTSKTKKVDTNPTGN